MFFHGGKVMGVIAREVAVIAMVLVVGVFPADAANQSAKLRASAHFDAAGNITNQVPNAWINSSSYDPSSGTFVIEFANGLFASTPHCTINTDNTPTQPRAQAWDAFPQPISAFSGGVVIVDSITPERHAHSLPSAKLVCVGN